MLTYASYVEQGSSFSWVTESVILSSDIDIDNYKRGPWISWIPKTCVCKRTHSCREKVRRSDHKFLCVIVRVKRRRIGRNQNPGPNIERNTRYKHSIPDNEHSTYHLTLHWTSPLLTFKIVKADVGTQLRRMKKFGSFLSVSLQALEAGKY